jgi:hypothetical protein
MRRLAETRPPRRVRSSGPQARLPTDGLRGPYGSISAVKGSDAHEDRPGHGSRGVSLEAKVAWQATGGCCGEVVSPSRSFAGYAISQPWRRRSGAQTGGVV